MLSYIDICVGEKQMEVIQTIENSAGDPLRDDFQKTMKQNAYFSSSI